MQKAAIFFMMLILLFMSCGEEKKQEKPAATDHSPQNKTAQFEPYTTIVSIDIIRDLMYNFASKRSKGRTLIQPGGNPLTYKLTEEDKRDLAEADLILYMGLGLEPDLEEFLKTLKGKVRIEALSDCLDKDELIKSDKYKGGYDPHFWWNPILWEKVVKHVTAIFTSVDRAFDYGYKSTYIRYGRSLSMLSRYFESWLGKLPVEDRILITINPAYSYLARDFGLRTESLSLPGESVDLETMVRVITANHVKAVFPEHGFDSASLVKLKDLTAARGYSLSIGPEIYSYNLDDAGKQEFSYIQAARALVDRVYMTLKPEGAQSVPK